MIADSVAFLAAAGQARHLRRRALLRRLRATTASYALRCLRAAADGGRRARRPVRHQRLARCPARSPRRSADVCAGLDGRRRVGIHCHNDAACGVANSLAGGGGGRDAGAGHDERLRRAHRQREPRLDHRQPPAQARPRGAAAERAGAADRDRALRRRAAEPRARPEPALRRPQRVRAQGRHARRRRPRRRRDVRARRPGARRQPPRAARLRARRARHGAARRPQAAGLALDDADGRRASIERVKELEHGGYQFEAADGSLRAAAAQGDRRLRAAVPAGVLARDRRAARRRQGRDRGDDQDLGRRRALRAHRRGQRPGQRARRGAARGDRRDPPAPARHRARQLQGAHPRRDARAPARSRACSSTPPTASDVWGSIGVRENVIEASWQALVDSLEYADAARPRRAACGRPQRRSEEIPLARPVLGPSRRSRRSSRSCAPGSCRSARACRRSSRRFAGPPRRRRTRAPSRSGTAGLHLALRAVGVADGDEVVTSPFSFVASAQRRRLRARHGRCSPTSTRSR